MPSSVTLHLERGSRSECVNVWLDGGRARLNRLALRARLNRQADCSQRKLGCFAQPYRITIAAGD